MALAIPRTLSKQRVLVHPECALFHCPPATIERNGRLPEWQRLDIAVKAQVWPSPAHTRVETADAWTADFCRRVAPPIQWVKDSGLTLIGEMDEVGRERPEQVATDTIDWVPDRLRYLASWLTALGNCPLIDVIDESDTKLRGWKPTKLVEAWSAANGPPLAWPALYPPHDFERKPGWSGATAREWPWWSARSFEDHIAFIRLALQKLPADRIVSCLICASDRWSDYPGTDPSWVLAQAWSALIRGASVLEFYHESGLKPGDALLAAVLGTIESIRLRRQMLRGKLYTPVRSGPFLVGRWQPDALVLVNVTDKPQDNPFARRRRKVPPAGVEFGSTLELIRRGSQ